MCCSVSISLCLDSLCEAAGGKPPWTELSSTDWVWGVVPGQMFVLLAAGSKASLLGESDHVVDAGGLARECGENM